MFSRVVRSKYMRILQGCMPDVTSDNSLVRSVVTMLGGK